jgi:hypothetical protein
MLSVSELDDSLKLKALARLMETKHPMLSIIKRKLDLANFFNPKCKISIDRVTNRALVLLAIDRAKLYNLEQLEGNRLFIRVVKNIRIRSAVNMQGLRSIIYRVTNQNGKHILGNLDRNELSLLGRYFIDKRLYELCGKIIDYRTEPMVEGDRETYLIRNKLVPLSNISSKEFRMERASRDPICIFKVGIILTPNESLSYMQKIKKLTSVRHRNVLLRVLHGDVYTNERLYRFGLTDSPNCDRCQELDTLEHRLKNCSATSPLVAALIELTNKCRTTIEDNEDELNKILMANKSESIGALALHAEIIGLIISKKNIPMEVTPYLTRLVEALVRKEGNTRIKNEIKALL